jgi:hypothetical protein
LRVGGAALGDAERVRVRLGTAFVEHISMQHWIDRSGIAHRPMRAPSNGPQLGVGDSRANVRQLAPTQGLSPA